MTSTLGIVTLDYPVKFGNETITEITVTRPKCKHLRDMGKHSGEESKSVALLASCANLPLSVIDEVDLTDFLKLAALLEQFAGKSQQETGKT